MLVKQEKERGLKSPEGFADLKFPPRISADFEDQAGTLQPVEEIQIPRTVAEIAALTDPDQVAAVREAYKRGGLSLTQLLKRRISRSFYECLRLANKERERVGKPRFLIPRKDSSRLYETYQLLLPQVIVFHESRDSKRKGYRCLHRHVLNQEVGAVVAVLTSIKPEPQPLDTRGLFERTEQEANQYFKRILSPLFSYYFAGRTPNSEKIYGLVYGWVIRIFERRVRFYQLSVEEAEDLASSVMEKLIPYLEGKRGNFVSIGQFRAFVGKICRNTFVDKLKKDRAKTMTFEEEWTSRSTRTEETTTFGEYTDEELERGLGKLTPGQREVLELTRDGSTIGETVQILRLSDTAVKARLHRARASLKYLLENPDKPRRYVQKSALVQKIEAYSPEEIAWATSRLSQSQRTTLELKARGLSYADIGREVGVSTGSVSDKLWGARWSLLRILEHPERPIRVRRPFTESMVIIIDMLREARGESVNAKFLMDRLGIFSRGHLIELIRKVRQRGYQVVTVKGVGYQLKE